MGNFKFRLSDMVPNAWFYKLKDMGGKGRDTPTNTNGNSSSSINSSTNSMEKKPKASPAITTLPPPKPKQSSHNPCPRKSYYFTRELIPNSNTTLLDLPDPPRRSSKHTARRRTFSRSSSKLVSAACSCRANLWTNNSKSDNFPLSPPDHEDSIISPVEAEPSETFLFPPEFRSDGVLTTQSFDEMLSLASKSRACKHETDNSSDIIIDVDNKSLARKPRKPLHPFDKVSELDLPPIVTKQVTQSDHMKEEETKKKQQDNSKELPPNKQRIKSATAKVDKQDQHKSSSNNSPRGRRYHNYSSNSPGIRLRINSPRMASRRSVVHHHQVQGRKSLSLSSSSGTSRSSSTTTTTTNSSSRRSLSASLAIVKSSFDPQRDFRESMVEMIVENNISASKDLEDLLACYLSLNSDEYHDLIIKIFKQIWFDFIHVNLN